MTKNKVNNTNYNIVFHDENNEVDGCFERIKQSELHKTLGYLPPKWTAIVYSIKNNLPIFSKIQK